MKWHLYKKDDPNTWPRFDSPMVVWTGEKLLLCDWYNDERKMFDVLEVMDPICFEQLRHLTEFYYAYIAYVPYGYKTHKVIMCTDDSNCKIGCNDNGYCMYDEFECENQRKVNEYSIEEKLIWQEF